jgi:DNA-binding response OmpR family regulator
MRILIAEDDKKVAEFIKKGLKEEQYAVDICFDGEEALFLTEINPYDLIILDIMLPKKNGFAVCREIRGRQLNTPIIMLTARSQVEDKVRGLREGADDYMSKPFAFEELLARIQALLRRSQNSKSRSLKVGELELDLVSRQVTRNGKKIILTGKEYALLEYLLRNKGRILTQTQIIEHVWDMNYEGLSNIVNVFINHLRDKIDNDFPEKYIHTIRGVGFKIDENQEI